MTVRGMLPTYNLLSATEEVSAVTLSATALSLLVFEEGANFRGANCGLRGWRWRIGRWVLQSFVGFCRKLGEIRDEEDEENAAISASK